MCIIYQSTILCNSIRYWSSILLARPYLGGRFNPPPTPLNLEEIVWCYIIILCELILWNRKQRNEPILERCPKIFEACSSCNQNIFPNISFLLKVLETLPVITVIWKKKNFSTLKRIKNYPWNATGEDRLTDLALHWHTLSVHRHKILFL